MQPRQQTNRYLVFRWGSRRHDWTMPRSGWNFLEQYQWGRKLGIDCFSVLLYHGVHGLPIPESSVDLNVNGGTNKGWSTGQDDDVSRYAQLMTNWPIFGNVCTDAIPNPMQSAFFPLSMRQSHQGSPHPAIYNLLGQDSVPVGCNGVYRAADVYRQSRLLRDSWGKPQQSQNEITL